MTGHGRLAAQRLPHPRAGAVLRGHLLPARASAAACRAGGACSTRWPTRGTSARDEIRAGGDAHRPSGSRAARGSSPRDEPIEPKAARRGRARRCAAPTTARTAASAARPSSRPRRRSSSCCAAARREMTAHTLRAMAAGGMYDQVGGGFARYSVDARWLVPHFEKMLYDNALLARAYLHGWQVTGEPLFRDGLRGDARLGPARDARRRRAASTPRSTPTPRASRASSTSGPSTSCARCSATTPTRPSPTSAPTTRGNFEGANILTRGRASPPELRRDQAAALRGARGARLARARRQAADVVERADDLRARRGRRGARSAPTTSTPRAACAEFVLRELRDADGRLLRTYKDGQAKLNAYLEDHAFLLEALLVALRGDLRPALVRAPRASWPTR